MPIITDGWLENVRTFHVGTAVVDYGNVPSPEAVVAVIGQTGILASSHVRVWFQDKVMSSNGALEHRMASSLVRLTPADIEPNVGFSIYADNIGGLATGKFRIDWIWS